MFTSAATASVAENSAGTVYTATATDADGDAITFSISGGADAGALQVTGAGALSFRVPPDFEAPTDANGDNSYEVTLAASDGRASTTLALRINVTNATTGSFVVRRVGTGFAAPVFATAMPDGSGRMIVVERAGRILLLNPTTGAIAATPMLDISGQVSTDGERGLLAVALAPDYATSGRAYAYLTAPDGSVQVRRYTSPAGNRDVLDSASGDVLLSIPHPRNNHNGGWLGFGADGLLYVATGDGGGGNDPDGNGQNRATLLGKMLRIDVSRDDFPTDPSRDYGIPSANPFASGGGAGEVWLYGLRNPFRNSFDRATGELWIADVGQGAVEEVDRVRTSQSGLNMGWPLYEGSQPLLGTNPAGLTMPVTEYGHGSGPLQGNSITGGFVYRGPVESLQGLYVFADFVSNNIWTVPIAGLTPGTTTPSSAFTNRNAAFVPDAGSLSGIVGFGEDQVGNLYIVSINGSIFAILPSI
ncbi:MAG: PQQ-dependent sugar dehydrogenase [Porphyrobacter sp.]|nr:PQQ-dependent sugar dehydrogenase [Porphyrobacter sp.]